MKYIKEEISGRDVVRYVFALGKSEAGILHALLEKAIKYMPRTLKTQTTEARMRNMAKEISKAIPEMKSQDDDYSI